MTEEEIAEEDGESESNSSSGGGEDGEGSLSSSSSQSSPSTRFNIQPATEVSQVPIEFETSEKLGAEIYGAYSSIAMDHIEDVLTSLIKQLELTSGSSRAVTINLIKHRFL